MKRDPYWFYEDERYLNRFNPDYPDKRKFIPALLKHPDDERANAEALAGKRRKRLRLIERHDGPIQSQGDRVQ